MKEVWIKAYRSPEYKKVLVDDEDYQKVAELSWHENKDGYAVRRDFRNEFGMGIQKTILMHRQILNVVTSTDHDYCVDHINGNRLDNRKENLRIVTLSVNSSNRHVVKASTGMLGVTEQHGRFIARARRDNIPRYLGSFDTVEEAKNAIELFDEFGLMKGKKKLVAPVAQLIEGTIVAVYPSIAEASRCTGVCSENISRVARKQRESAGGFQWRVMDDLMMSS